MRVIILAKILLLLTFIYVADLRDVSSEFFFLIVQLLIRIFNLHIPSSRSTIDVYISLL
jgi:hypothetical protein